MSRASRISAFALLCALPLAAAIQGCAAHQVRPGRPIEEIPRPPQPPAEPPAAADTVPPVPPPLTMTPSGEGSMRSLVLRDTVAVSKALKRCAGKHMLPEMESTYDATAKLLAQTREALLSGDVARARSLARNARQLVTSLDCP